MKPFLFGLGGAVLAAVVLFVGFHLWQDHQNLHAIVNMIVQQQPAK